jgi:hypothetical protein
MESKSRYTESKQSSVRNLIRVDYKGGLYNSTLSISTYGKNIILCCSGSRDHSDEVLSPPGTTKAILAFVKTAERLKTMGEKLMVMQY